MIEPSPRYLEAHHSAPPLSVLHCSLPPPYEEEEKKEAEEEYNEVRDREEGDKII